MFRGVTEGVYYGTPATDSSWTDGIPLCPYTGVGFAQNQVYRRDGYRTSECELEDESFHFQCDEGNICLYGVFDGHFGPQAARFVVQKMPAEIILDQQLTEATTEDTVREVLRQAFLSVEREYFNDAIGAILAQRAMYLADNSREQGPYETFSECPPRLLAGLNKEVQSGTTAVVALIFNGKLYVSNVGCCRAFLFRTDKDGILRVIQLSVDHNLNNQDELQRLRDLGLDVDELRRQGKIGNINNTRCLGNYLVKGGYKEYRELSGARSEPVIPDPEIHPAIKVDESFRFLALLSEGLYQALQEATENDQVDIQLARMIVDEFKAQSTLNLVAQAVVDKVSRMHHEYCMNATSTQTLPKVARRDDMTLLVRNFSIPLKNTPKNGYFTPTSSLFHSTTNDCSTPTNLTMDTSPTPKVIQSPFTTFSNTEATTSTESSEFTQSNHKLPLDENGRIVPYTNFESYYQNLASRNVTDDDLFS